jgi:hypothetical protein
MLGKLMTDWGDSYRNQSILIDTELKEYFKYIRNEYAAFREVD